MIVLFNFNAYLGGGETLLVRFSEYMYKQGILFHSYCLRDSFIAQQMKKNEIPETYYTCINNDCNYAYLNESQRRTLITEIDQSLPKSDEYHYVTFCLRDLYMLIDFNKIHQGSIIHLVLHNQDYLYLGRSLLDGLKGRFLGTRTFNNKMKLEFNHKIINLVNDKRGLIPMSWIIVQLWKKEAGVDIPEEMIVSLPSFSKRDDVSVKTNNNKKIIFIGRLVDFKFASLFAMFNYIKRNPEYHLTVVGNGDKGRAEKYIKEHSIPVDNIHFRGEVSYSELPKVISEHSIGYAAGTSIIECAQQGIPVIMALQNNANKPFQKDICGGLFYKTTKGNLGEDLCIYQESDIETTIDEAIAEIENDYPLAARRCYEYVMNEYSNEVNFMEYIKRINATSLVDTTEIEVPFVGKLRKYLFSRIG